MSNLQVKICNKSNNALPEYATAGSSGLDLRADLTTPVELKPLERALIPTGLYLELPIGYEAQVRPRSGLAAKQGITCLNTPGTIDSDYRGEIKVILINLSAETVVIQNSERIAQLVFQKVERVDWVETQEGMSSTERGGGGFGHTGKH